MLLFIKDGCPFCKDLKVEGLQVFKIVDTSEGPKLDVGGIRVEIPVSLEAIPALFIENNVFYGLTLIEEELKKKIPMKTVAQIFLFLFFVGRVSASGPTFTPTPTALVITDYTITSQGALQRQFVSASTTAPKKLFLYLKKTGSPAFGLIAAVYPDNGSGGPDCSVPAVTYEVAPTSVSDSYDSVELLCSSNCSASLFVGQTYWVLFYDVNDSAPDQYVVGLRNDQSSTTSESIPYNICNAGDFLTDNAVFSVSTPVVVFSPTPVATATITPIPDTFTDSPTQTVTETATPSASPSGTITLTTTTTSTITPRSTKTFTGVLSATPSITVAPNTATITPISTTTFTSTVSPTATPSTVLPSSTVTRTKTGTPVYSVTSTITPSYTVTVSPTPSFSSSPTNTITPRSTGISTETVTPAATQPSPVNTATITPRSTFTYTSTVSPTSTVTKTTTTTPVFTTTTTPTKTRTLTITKTTTATVTPTKTTTPTITITARSTFTSSLTPTPQGSLSPTDMDSPTITPRSTWTFSLTPSYTMTFSCSPTPLSTKTYTVTSVDTITSTLTVTATGTKTPTLTRTPTKTVTVTRTFTITTTASPTPTFTQTFTATAVPGTVLSFPDLNSGGKVYALLYKSGVVYVGGLFTTIGGQSRNNLAAINSSTGAVLPWNPNVNTEVFALATSGNILYIGGTFSTVGGVNRGKIASFFVDSGNITPWPFSSLSGAFNAGSGAIHSLAVSPAENRVYVGGPFSRASAFGSSKNNIAAVDMSTGVVSSTFPEVSDTGTSYDVKSIQVSAGTVYFGGVFTHFGGYARVGSAAVTSDIIQPWDPQSNGTISSLSVDPAGTVFLAGAYSTLRGTSAVDFAQVDSTYGYLTAFAPTVTGPVKTLFQFIAPQLPSSPMVAFGASDTTDVTVGAQTRTGFGLLDVNCPLCLSNLATSFTGTTSAVNAMAYDAINNILFVGGDFDTVESNPTNGLAAVVPDFSN